MYFITVQVLLIIGKAFKIMNESKEYSVKTKNILKVDI